MAREVEVNIGELEEAINEMNPSRHRMYNAIVDLNEIRKRLSTGEVWQGEGASAVLNAYNNTLYNLLKEEKRLNAYAGVLANYKDELIKREEEAAKSAANVTVPGRAEV